MADALIKCRNLCVIYGENEVLRRTSFDICRGDFVCIVGANGSGKSTLVKAVLGLIRIKSGTVSFADGLSAQKIGYMPQDTSVAADFPATVNEIVLSGALGRMRWRVFYSADERKRAEECLKKLRISKLAQRRFTELSGGQRQKVLLARALMASGDVLFLDEPSNNLDYKSKAEFYNQLKRLNEENGLTIAMITHDVDVHDLVGNKVLALREDGVWMGSTADYLEVIHEHC